MFRFNIDRIIAAAAKGSYPATPEDCEFAIMRPIEDDYYAENCYDAWQHNILSVTDWSELYCSYSTACDSVSLTAENIGPNGDMQCKDCAAVAEALEIAFERDCDY